MYLKEKDREKERPTNQGYWSLAAIGGWLGQARLGYALHLRPGFES